MIRIQAMQSASLFIEINLQFRKLGSETAHRIRSYEEEDSIDGCGCRIEEFAMEDEGFD
jgi:hypothetical protein